MKEPPDVVRSTLELLAQNPLLEGATLEAAETSPNVWEIWATAKVCVSCTRRVGSPSGPVTVVNEGRCLPGVPTVMPHVCPSCAQGIAEGFMEAQSPKEGMN